MGDRVKLFLERVADIPTELRRRLALIRDLDDKASQLQRDIEDNVKQQLSEAQKSHNKGQGKRQKLQAGSTFDVDASLRRLMSLADEKVHIAVQVYDFVDKHIRHLDGDLCVLREEVNDEREELGLGPDETASGRLGLQLPHAGAFGQRGAAAAVAAAAAAAAASEKKTKGGRGHASRKKGTEAELQDEALLHLANTEPNYCTCQQPSYGEMVKCDNDDCAIEWFHVGCVGLPAGFEGDFLCQTCRPGPSKQDPATQHPQHAAQTGGHPQQQHTTGHAGRKERRSGR